MQKRDTTILIEVVIVIVAITAVLYIVSNDDSSPRVSVSESLIETTDFDLINDNGLGSTAKGTILFIDEEERIRVRVIAHINLIPNDVGGFRLTGQYHLNPESIIYQFNGDLSSQDIDWAIDIPSGDTAYGLVMVSAFPKTTDGATGTMMVDFVTSSSIEGVDSITIGVQIGLYGWGTYTCTL